MPKKPKKNFLKLPEFPGGREAFKKYIIENLKYPKEALEKRIEGIVYLSADIDDNGRVLQVYVDNGIGYGCDKEAVRLLKSIQFGGVKNRGIRLKSKKKFRIEFKLPPQKKIIYSINKGKTNVDSNKDKTTFSYTINLSKK